MPEKRGRRSNAGVSSFCCFRDSLGLTLNSLLVGKEATTPDSRMKVVECRASHSGKMGRSSLWQCHTVIWAHMKDALSTEIWPSVASVGTTQRMATDDKVGRTVTNDDSRKRPGCDATSWCWVEVDKRS